MLRLTEKSCTRQRKKKRPNHAFVDGNKRIGMYVLLTFLEANGISLDAENPEVVRAGVNVATGVWKYAELLKWIKEKE